MPRRQLLSTPVSLFAIALTFAIGCQGSMKADLRPHTLAIGPNGGAYHRFEYDAKVVAPPRLRTAMESACE